LFSYLILIKLFLWSLQTIIIFISECRWNRIFLDKLFSIFLMAHCRALLLMCFLLMILLFRLILFFFVRSSMINLFSVHCFLLFQWMYCILLSIAKPRNVFGVLLTKPSFPRLILVLYNFMGLSKIFVRVMIRSLYICRR
jgi:hypothetical protein